MKRALAVGLLLLSFAAVALEVGPRTLTLMQGKKPEAGVVRVADGSDPPDFPPCPPGVKAWWCSSGTGVVSPSTYSNGLSRPLADLAGASRLPRVAPQKSTVVFSADGSGLPPAVTKPPKPVVGLLADGSGLPPATSPKPTKPGVTV